MSKTEAGGITDATTTVKGKIKLAGSLGGTADAPTVVTNANLTGAVTSSGNATSLGSFTTAALNTALSDNDVATLAGTENLTNKTLDSTSPTAFFYPGFIQAYAVRTAPTGWLNCDGSAVSRSTYAALFAAIVPTKGTTTMTIASPAVVTNTGHGLSTGDSVYFTNSGGALPTGITANTLYYVIRIDANTFNVATSRANAYASTKVNTSGSQSGTHTLWDCPFGLGDGSTTFTLPDYRGRILAGLDTTGGTAASRLTLAQTQGVYGNIGATGGEEGHQITTAELASHTHPNNLNATAGSPIVRFAGSAGSGQTAVTTGTTGSDTAHNNVQPIQLANYIIKT